MLVGFIPIIGGAKVQPTLGIDGSTRALFKFNEANAGTLMTAAVPRDTVKTSRALTGGANASFQAGKFACCACSGGGPDGIIRGTAGDVDFNFVFDFTIDFFYKHASGGYVISRVQHDIGPWAIFNNGGALLFFASSNGTAWDIVPGLSMGAVDGSKFVHYAVQRQGNTYTTWRNGALVASVTSALAHQVAGTVPLCLFGANDGTGTSSGYLDELRFSNVARYGGNFTPLNRPYYKTLSGGNDAATKMLLHLNQSAGDTAVGTATPHAFSTFGATYIGTPGSTARAGNVLQIAANGDRLVANNYTDLEPGDADFTIDFNYFRSLNGNAGDVVSKRATSGAFAPWAIYDYGNNEVQALFSFSGGGWDYIGSLTGGGGIPTGVWYHMAVVRNRNLLSGYLNGGLVFQADIGAQPLWLGNDQCAVGGNNLSSSRLYLDEIRYSDVARWTAPFDASPYMPGQPQYS